MRVSAIACLFLLLCPLILASEPGQPLDCDDWVTLAPGLSVEFAGRVTGEPWRALVMGRVAIDAAGRLIVVGGVNQQSPSPCPPGPIGPLPIRVLDRSGMEEHVACVSSRDGPYPGSYDAARLDLHSCYDNANERNSCVRFNQVTGQLFFTFEAFGQGASPGTDYTETQVCVINGFPTLNDIAQTFVPVAEMGFYVPLMPEGFRYADYFDTYWGHLDTVGDWSQAEPLQCGYPATPPSWASPGFVDTQFSATMGAGRFTAWGRSDAPLAGSSSWRP